MDTNLETITQTAKAGNQPGKFLLFQNKGEIAIEAFSLIGASTKRNDDTKIGFFGSGLKYSIPVLMREGIDFHIYSGTEKISFTTTKKSIREMEFDVICINGIETSLTTQMGPQWKLWYAIREIYSNMIDEADHDFSICNDVEGVAGTTRIYVNTSTESVQEIYKNFYQYFSSFRDDVICYDAEGNAALDKRDELVNIYRKGIKCFDDELPGAFDYDFQNIPINESRVANTWDIYSNVAKFWGQCDDPKAILRFIQNCNDRGTIEGHTAANYNHIILSKLNKKAWNNALHKKRLVPIELTGYVEDLNPLTDIYIPNCLYKPLRDKLERSHNLGFDTEMPYKEYTTTPFQDAILKRATQWFIECMSPITYPIKVVSFLDEKTYGMAREGNIYLCQKAFIKGKDFVALVLLEEQMHLEHRVKDESRPFQTLLLEHVIYYMSQINANPL